MAKNILKEAIADAKAVREVALANAKAALEEAFTPRLQSMLSAKLSEELDEDSYMDEDEDIDMDMMEMDMDDTSEDDMDMDEDMYTEESEEESYDEEIDLEEILNELELEGDSEELVDEVKDIEGDEELEEHGGLNQTKPNYTADDMHKVTYTSRNIYEEGEFDLDALLNEINDLDEEPKSDEKMDEVLGMDLTEIIALLLPMIGVPTAMFVAAGGKEALKEKMASASGPKEKLKAFTEFLGEMSGSTSAGIGKDVQELSDTKEALKTVKNELNEVNLLNSKLLYVNRIFKANTLDEGQKLRVVETLDKAETAKEAKLIYETIKDTFTVANNKKTSFKNKTKSLKEGIGMASRAAGTSTAPKKEVISESNDMMKRFQKLANIKIN